MAWTAIRFHGRFECVMETVTGNCVHSTDPRWSRFLEWNAKQPVPLDTSDHPPPVPTAKELAATQLAATDNSMIRVIEDIWSALKSKNLVTDADLPAASADKLANRKTLREALR